MPSSLALSERLVSVSHKRKLPLPQTVAPLVSYREGSFYLKVLFKDEYMHMLSWCPGCGTLMGMAYGKRTEPPLVAEVFAGKRGECLHCGMDLEGWAEGKLVDFDA